MDVDGVENAILNANKSKQVGGIKCKKCDKNTVNFFEVQARGADEGASVFYSCTSCLAHWRQH